MNDYEYRAEKINYKGQWEATNRLLNGDKISLNQANEQMLEIRLKFKSEWRLVKLTKEVVG